MGILLAIVDEVDRQYREGLDWQAYLRKMAREYEKAHNLTDQSIGNEHTKNINSSISDNQDIDNGLVYNLETGEVEGEL